MISRKKLWMRPWKTHWRNQYIRWQEIGRRQDVEEVVVILTYSVGLVWLLIWFVSKRFIKEIIKWLDYQSYMSKSLIIKVFDNQTKNSTIKSIRVGKKFDVFPWSTNVSVGLTCAKYTTGTTHRNMYPCHTFIFFLPTKLTSRWFFLWERGEERRGRNTLLHWHTDDLSSSRIWKRWSQYQGR